MATSTAYEWDITEPVTATGAVTDGAAEIRYLKAATGARFETDHLVPQDTASGTVPYGGEHMLGSARCFVGTSNPLYMPYGGTSTDTVFTEREFSTTEGTNNWDNATGRMMFDTGDSENSLSILTSADGAGSNTWTEIGYLKKTGTTSLIGNCYWNTDNTVVQPIEIANSFTYNSGNTAGTGGNTFGIISKYGGLGIGLGYNNPGGAAAPSGVHLRLYMSIASSRPEGHIYFDPITQDSTNNNITPSSGSAVLTWTDGNFEVATNPSGSRVQNYIPLSTGSASADGDHASTGTVPLVINGTTYNVMYYTAP